ncbi:transglutaminase family protein [Lichenihabitans sp. Uapishka_5]|uniref:transglutaminase-like domain-containing protein n=1 Tax=Lichenihabitans sp. Uapishka_5 TaxID=3037302 RepID=UPI0029E81126|nr:transglutaminase family protein [Lichenihabitans sp. Uapishka_5]MDX7949808.1 transglutaminase family protein [Lichenihabitans sp. Uapishka_5]
MRIRCGFDISYLCNAPTAMSFLLSVRPEREPHLVSPQNITCEPFVPMRGYRDGFGNRVKRILAPAGEVSIRADFTVEDSGLLDEADRNAVQHNVEDLPDDVMVFLMPSRYCDTEHLSGLAWSLFGNTRLGWDRVQAIVDYAHDRIRFDYQQARATRTASEGHFEQVGVCRDFAHLAVTLCRCMNIPARYATGYLGDIGVPIVPDPMDFSAWFEVYLGGRWWTFDARHNKRRIGRIVMAYGRDAVDVAISTAFGYAGLLKFNVITEELPEATSHTRSYSTRFPATALEA